MRVVSPFSSCGVPEPWPTGARVQWEEIEVVLEGARSLELIAIALGRSLAGFQRCQLGTFLSATIPPPSGTSTG